MTPNLLPTITFCTLVITGLIPISGSAGGDEDHSIQASLRYEEALEAFQGSDLNTAKIHLKNAILEDPELISAHILLGRIYLEEGDGSLAEKEFLVAERLGASTMLTLVPRAKALISQRKYRELLETLQPTGVSAEVDGEFWVLRGDAHLESDQLAEAAAAYDKAAGLLPNKASPLIGRASVLLYENRLTQAKEAIAAALALEPDNVPGWRLMGSLEHARGSLPEALEAYRKAATLDPKNLSAQIGYIGVLIDMADYPKAVQVANDAQKTHPSDPRIPYLRSVALARQGNQAESYEALKKSKELLDALPERVFETHGPSMMLAGLVNFTLKNREQAYVHLERYMELHPDHPGTRKLMGMILMSKGEVDRAIDTLEPALAAAPEDVRLLTLLSEAYSRKRQYVKADDMLKKALELDPQNPDTLKIRAFNNLDRGDDLPAIADLDRLFEEQPESEQIGVTLVLSHMKRRDYAAALSMARRLVESQPDRLDHLSLLAAAQAASGNTGAARETYGRMLGLDPDFLPAMINIGKLDLADGKAQEAERRFSLLIEKHPDQNILHVELARALEAQGKSGEAIRRLEKARAMNSKALDVTGHLVELLIRNGQAYQAKKVAQQAQLVAPGDFRVLKSLGLATLALGRKPDAAVYFRRMSTDAGYEAHKLFGIARLQWDADDRKGAIWSLQKAVQGDPDFLQAQVLLAGYLGESGQEDKQRAQAGLVRQRFPGEAVGYRLLGDIALREGRTEEAVSLYTTANEKRPETAGILGLTRALLTSGKDDKAQDTLVSWLRIHPDDPLARQALAEIHLKQGAWKLAREAYEAIVRERPDTAAALNNLAVIYAEQGDGRAEEYARRAHALAPKDPSVSDTLGWILVRNGNTAEGLKYLRNASALAPADPEIHYHLAATLHRLGREQEAATALQKALADGKERSWTADAAALKKALK